MSVTVLYLGGGAFFGTQCISSLPLSRYRAVEMLRESALYKSIIDIDIQYASTVMLTKSLRVDVMQCW